MSQTTSAYADPKPKPFDGSGVTVETKLMKQFRLAWPVHGGNPGCGRA